MSTFIVLGKFSGQGAKGLMTSDADRSAIVDKAARAAGAKMISYHITRGIYDFCVIAEGDDEETVIAMKGTVMMSGDFDQIDILSSVDVNKVRDKVKAIWELIRLLLSLNFRKRLDYIGTVTYKKLNGPCTTLSNNILVLASSY